MIRLAGFLLLALSLAAAQPAKALVIDLTADIGGENNVPPTDSLAFGTGVFEYDDVSNVLTWTILFTASLFDTGETGAQIRGPAAPGSEADLLVDLGTGQLKQGSINLNAISSCSADPEACQADLLANLWYVSIDSTEHPEGEIRGQIVANAPVPEPAALSLLVLTGIGGLMIRRQLSA